MRRSHRQRSNPIKVEHESVAEGDRYRSLFPEEPTLVGKRFPYDSGIEDDQHGGL